MKPRTVLTAKVRDEIEQLAQAPGKPKVSEIARQLGLKAWTVYWHMLSVGLIKKKPGRYRHRAYERRGVMVHPFSPEQDKFITEMCMNGASNSAIARAAMQKFGIQRLPTTIRARLVMLAAIDDESEAA